MQRQFPDPIRATAAPTTADMLRVWRADRCVQNSSTGLYLQWIKRFRAYCAHHKLDERAELTLEVRVVSPLGMLGAVISIRGG